MQAYLINAIFPKAHTRSFVRVGRAQPASTDTFSDVSFYRARIKPRELDFGAFVLLLLLLLSFRAVHFKFVVDQLPLLVGLRLFFLCIYSAPPANCLSAMLFLFCCFNSTASVCVSLCACEYLSRASPPLLSLIQPDMHLLLVDNSNNNSAAVDQCCFHCTVDDE